MKGLVIMAASGGGNGEIAEMRDWRGEWGARPGGAGPAAGPAGQARRGWRRRPGMVGLDVGEGDGGVGEAGGV